jgi:hypothetical protein
VAIAVAPAMIPSSPAVLSVAIGFPPAPVCTDSEGQCKYIVQIVHRQSTSRSYGKLIPMAVN